MAKLTAEQVNAMDQRQTFESLERHFPEFVRPLLPPVIAVPGSHHSHLGIGYAVIDHFAFSREHIGARLDSARRAPGTPTTEMLAMSYALVRDRWPIHWVAKELALSALNTRPPEDLNLATDMTWPRRSLLFMLPKGTLLTSYGEVAAVGIAHIAAGEVLEPPNRAPRDGLFTPNFKYDTDGEGDNVLLSVFAEMHGAYGQLCCVSYNVETTTGRVFGDHFPSNTSYTEVHRENIATIESALNLALTLALLMQAQPGLITSDEAPRRVSTREGRPIVAAKWIGRSYRLRREPGVGSHAAPRMHWRNGHWRRQPYGEGATLRKLIWIEPVLVNANVA
jgi:hypothetical protein